MKKLMLIVMMFMIAMVPFAQARHDHGPSRDMQTAYGIMGLVDWGVNILGRVFGGTQTVTYVAPPVVTAPAPVVVQQPAVTLPPPPVVVTPPPVVYPTYPTAPIVVTTPQYVKPWGPRGGHLPPPPPPRGGHNKHHGGRHGR